MECRDNLDISRLTVVRNFSRKRGLEGRRASRLPLRLQFSMTIFEDDYRELSESNIYDCKIVKESSLESRMSDDEQEEA